MSLTLGTYILYEQYHLIQNWIDVDKQVSYKNITFHNIIALHYVTKVGKLSRYYHDLIHVRGIKLRASLIFKLDVRPCKS